MTKAEPFVAAPARAAGLAALAPYGIYLSMVAAWVATLGSLYFSEVLGFIPCALCWWQRIFMYPIALLLTLGLFREDEGVGDYALLLAVPGIGFSTYHYLLQKTDLFGSGDHCAVTSVIPCKTDYINWLGGAITIPALAWIAFLLIIVGALATRWSWQQETAE